MLGREEILKRVDEINLIEGFSQDCLESCGYDLRISKAYSINSESFIGKTERKTPEVTELDQSEFTLKPKGYVLIETVEKVNMPADLSARILPRSSVFRCGCNLLTALVDPGYCGALTMGLFNCSDYDFVFEKDARIGQIVFEKVYGETKMYDGKYQGGKVV